MLTRKTPHKLTPTSSIALVGRLLSLPLPLGLNATIRAGVNEFFIHKKNQREYFIIENRWQTGRDRALPGSGLAIWHIDELGDNENQGMTPNSHYECSLVQADGEFDLELWRSWG